MSVVEEKKSLDVPKQAKVGPKKWSEDPSPVPFYQFSHYTKQIEKRRFYYFNQWRLLPGDEISPKPNISKDKIPPAFFRHKDIEPFEHNRVRVPVRADEVGYGDYFNASWIQGSSIIACECPSTEGLNAFWNMVWHYKVSLIVMLGDNLKSKLIPAYWPVMKNKGYNSSIKGDLSLRLEKKPETKLELPPVTFRFTSASGTTEVMEVAALERKMEMYENADSTKRLNLTHLQFAGWPDGGTLPPEALPSFAKFFDYFRALRKALPPNECFLVHCSAGVGQTGVFLALYLIMELVDKCGSSSEVNVFDVVSRLRKDRMMMVQSDEQYAFIHKFLETRCGGVVPPVQRLLTMQSTSKGTLPVLLEYDEYRSYLKTTPSFQIRARLVRLVADRLAGALKQAYQHKLKSTMYYFWRGLIRALLDLFDRDTRWHWEFIFGLVDRGSMATLNSLKDFVERAVAMWEQTDVKEEDLRVPLHTCELDIYCCCRDMLEQTKMLTPKTAADERQFLLLENRLDRLFWYRFFLRRSEVPLSEFAKVLRVYLEVGPHPELISLTDDEFEKMLMNSFITARDPEPKKVTPRSYYFFLQRYGPLGSVYPRMRAMCLKNGQLAPWFRPELSREAADLEFPINGFNFVLRLGTDQKSFVLHCHSGDEGGQTVPLKVHRDSKGYYWEIIQKTNQRLDDMRSLLYKYVLEIKNSYKEERSKIDAEMKEWADQDDAKRPKMMVEQGLNRLANMFQTRLFQDDYFDLFYRQFKPNPVYIEKMFGYIDNDKNTTLDSHEIRVGLLLLFAPLLDDLNKLVVKTISLELKERQWYAEWAYSYLAAEFRTVASKFFEWLPIASESQLFSMQDLEGEVARVAAKLCSHTMEVVTACNEFKQIGIRAPRKPKAGMEDIVDAFASNTFSSRARVWSLGEPQRRLQKSEMEMATFSIVVSQPEPAAATPAAESKAEAKAHNTIRDLIRGWQLRRSIKLKLNEGYKGWVSDVLAQAITFMGYVAPPTRYKLWDIVLLFFEIAVLPLTAAVYWWYYDQSHRIRYRSKPKKDEKTCLQKLLAFLQAVAFVVSTSVMYYGTVLGWGLIAMDVINVSDLDSPFHWMEFTLPVTLFLFNMFTVMVAEAVQKKLTDFELEWQVASLTIRQTEVKFREQVTESTLAACAKSCINGKEGLHHSTCPVMKQSSQPWNCLTAISEDFFINADGAKADTPLRGERYFRFLIRHILVPFRCRLPKKKNQHGKSVRQPTPFGSGQLSVEEERCCGNFWAVFLVVIAAVIHAMIPGLHRYTDDFTFFGSHSPSAERPNPLVVAAIILNMFGTFSGTFVYLMLMLSAVRHYDDVKRVLIRVLALTDAERALNVHKWPRYLALDEHPNNLLFWTRVREHAKARVDSSVLTVMSIALLVDAAIIGRLVYVELSGTGTDSAPILNVMNIYQALILSFLIGILFNIVVKLNTKVFLDTTTVLQTLQLNLSQRLMEMEQARSMQLANKVSLVYERRYTPVLEIQQYDKPNAALPVFQREKSNAYGFAGRPAEEDGEMVSDAASNKSFCHPKDALEAKSLRKEEERAHQKEEDDIREMAAFVNVVQASIDKVRCVELPIEILGMSVDTTFRTRLLAGLLTGVGSVFLAFSSSTHKDDTGIRVLGVH